ncbi:hypothetical protein FJO69_02765 [[Mycoplasma] falconis]|uniref:Uncharacterized protein n=1 Tax=[Mycoplasma] falconis TaxID=92403 RepID=A0A501X8I5_9BACT|nr:hypothetical protein [[Mycoplasma] falconis]TPE56766.1 hypothetical protein FJO69_02765 [[Mycoplasma] falconis]
MKIVKFAEGESKVLLPYKKDQFIFVQDEDAFDTKALIGEKIFLPLEGNFGYVVTVESVSELETSEKTKMWFVSTEDVATYELGLNDMVAEATNIKPYKEIFTGEACSNMRWATLMVLKKMLESKFLHRIAKYGEEDETEDEDEGSKEYIKAVLDYYKEAEEFADRCLKIKTEDIEDLCKEMATIIDFIASHDEGRNAVDSDLFVKEYLMQTDINMRQKFIHEMLLNLKADIEAQVFTMDHCKCDEETCECENCEECECCEIECLGCKKSEC